MKKLTKNVLAIGAAITGILTAGSVSAQTDMDAIMMNKQQTCHGFTYDYSSWDLYWEGTFKRDNQNLGTVSSQMLMYMGAYGITNDLNVLVGVPYVWTKASAGTLHANDGVQDLSLFVKWKAITKSFGKNQFSLIGVGGFSTPLSNYVIDYLPLSIGLGSTNATARGIIDYRRGNFTATGSAAYVWRSNVNIDRPAYFDTEQHNTTEVDMPNVAVYQLRTGYRGHYLIAEAVLTNMTTLGGFDITKNNMPFPSNRMNATTVGAAFKYTFKRIKELSLVGGANFTVAGRNVGQSKMYSAGVYYAFYVGKKTKS